MKSFDGVQIELMVQGLGIILCSPANAAHIKEGEDYLSDHYSSEASVQEHIQAGTIVGFGTGSPGDYTLRFHSGYPSEQTIDNSDFAYRLGLRCVGGEVCCRDLYELMDWRLTYHSNELLHLPDGIYHVTLLSDVPSSGIIGDHQVIHVYLQELSEFPKLRREGIPMLGPTE